jgi:hypothetical protein
MRGSSCKVMKMLPQCSWITEDVQSGGIPGSCPQEEQDYHYGWSMERFSNLPSFAGRRGNASHAPLDMTEHEIAFGFCRRPFFNAQNNQPLRPPEEHPCRPRTVLQMFTIEFLFRDVKVRQRQHKREEKRRNLEPSSTTLGGTRWRSWLRHCATSRKVAGSITDGVIGIFRSYNPTGRNMALSQ